jgi:5-methylcytosine-specific restriction endonuclease McrA
MTTSLATFDVLSDRDLLAAVHRLAQDERHATAALIASLAELDTRRLYLGEGCSSLFTYCTRVLHLSEHAAYGRIEAARAARRFPVVLDRLADGSLTLTAVGLLAPHLTAENHTSLLDAARHRTKREIEQLVAAIRPRPSVPATVRKLPVASAARPDSSAGAAALPGVAASAVNPVIVARAESWPIDSPPPPPAPSPARRPVLQPLAPACYKVQFTLDESGVALLRRAQALMRHRLPNGNVALVFAEALQHLVEHLEKSKLAAGRPRATSRSSHPRSRRIPAAVRRAVWARDEGRCAFVGTLGRCSETGVLEFHHVRPYADGGLAVVENIELRCRAHNQYEAEQWFGAENPWTARETCASQPHPRSHSRT